MYRHDSNAIQAARYKAFAAFHYYAAFIMRPSLGAALRVSSRPSVCPSVRPCLRFFEIGKPWKLLI